MRRVVKRPLLATRTKRLSLPSPPSTMPWAREGRGLRQEQLARLVAAPLVLETTDRQAITGSVILTSSHVIQGFSSGTKELDD